MSASTLLHSTFLFYFPEYDINLCSSPDLIYTVKLVLSMKSGDGANPHVYDKFMLNTSSGHGWSSGKKYINQYDFNQNVYYPFPSWIWVVSCVCGGDKDCMGLVFIELWRCYRLARGRTIGSWRWVDAGFMLTASWPHSWDMICLHAYRRRQVHA